MRPLDFDINELIESLRGTTNDIDAQLPDGMEWQDLTTADHEAIDSAIFLCEQCGWWCERDEESEDKEMHCNDCANDE